MAHWVMHIGSCHGTLGKKGNCTQLNSSIVYKMFCIRLLRDDLIHTTPHVLTPPPSAADHQPSTMDSFDQLRGQSHVLGHSNVLLEQRQAILD